MLTPSKELVVPRGFIIIRIFLDLGNDTYAFAATSIDVDYEPPKGTIIGDIWAVHIFEPVSGDNTKTNYQNVMLADPKG